MCSLRSCYLREKSFMGVGLKSIHTLTFITVFTASASIRVSARNASLYIAVMIFCAQPYLKPCFMCYFYILSTCPSKGLCTALAVAFSVLGRDRHQRPGFETRSEHERVGVVWTRDWVLHGEYRSCLLNHIYAFLCS